MCAGSGSTVNDATLLADRHLCVLIPIFHLCLACERCAIVCERGNTEYCLPYRSIGRLREFHRTNEIQFTFDFGFHFIIKIVNENLNLRASLPACIGF